MPYVSQPNYPHHAYHADRRPTLSYHTNAKIEVNHFLACPLKRGNENPQLFLLQALARMEPDSDKGRAAE
jgi:hypothetical protein